MSHEPPAWDGAPSFTEPDHYAARVIAAEVNALSPLCKCGHALNRHSIAGPYDGECVVAGCQCREFYMAPREDPTPVKPACPAVPMPPPSSEGDLTYTQLAIKEECQALATMLIEKNRAYGDSALRPLRVFSSADPVEQIRVRIDDKLSRLARGSAAGEDVELDLMGYLVLLRVAKKMGGGK